MDWAATVSAIAAAIATIAAILSLLRATGLERETWKDTLAESRSNYFKAMLTKPLSRETDRQAELIMALTTKAEDDLRLAGKDAARRDAILMATINQIHRGFLTLRNEMRVGTASWSDNELTAKLFAGFDSWDTHTLVVLNALAGPAADDPVEALQTGCNSFRTVLRRTLFETDPLMCRDRDRRVKISAFMRFFRGL